MTRLSQTGTIRRSPDGKVRIVSIISGKGGVGKTVVAFNLAERLADAGARVLLVDADFNCGNQHILANTAGDYGLRETIRGQLTLKEAIVHTPYGFDLLAAGGGNLMTTDNDVTPFATVMSKLRADVSNYDLILIDHGSGISKAATVMTHASETVVLLLVPELTSISDCYGLYKHLKQVDSSLDCRLVINRVESPDEARYIYTKLCALSERFLGHVPLYLGYLSEDRSFRASIASQAALSKLGAETPAIQELTYLARDLLYICGLSEQSADRRQLTNQKTINKTTALADIRE